MERINVICPGCQTEQSLTSYFSFRAECDACSTDLHVCQTCQFYDPHADNQCRESSAEYIANKSRRNLCDYWKPKTADGSDNSAADAKAKLDALFGDKSPTSSHDSERLQSEPAAKQDNHLDKLNALFKNK